MSINRSKSTIYSSNLINIYKKIGDDYILHGKINNVESHGNNSNAMSKISDNLFCSGGKNGLIYIVSVESVEVIQKINLSNEENSFDYVRFLHNSNDGYIFTSFNNKIIQFKIVVDDEGNFKKLKKFDEIDDKENNNAIITTDNG